MKLNHDYSLNKILFFITLLIHRIKPKKWIVFAYDNAFAKQ